MKYNHSFFNDYSEGCHPDILEILNNTNLEQEAGYGEDSISKKAINLIKEEIKNNDVDIHFVSGGTQANIVVLSSILKPYESIIAAETSHINVHEAGAIEATGHKINLIESHDGKLNTEQVWNVLESHTDEHMVKPKIVFISQSTEIGTVYTKDELKKLYYFCKENDLYLYIDGARIASAVASEESNMSLADVTEFSDAFYIGGTKNGVMLGEAIVIKNPEIKENFRFHLKQKGALLAKGRIVGAQFSGLFENSLYLKNAKYANKMASELSHGIKDLDYEFLSDSTTNQIFPIFPNEIVDKLKEKYGFYVWNKIDKNNSVIRLVTSWVTPEEKIIEFINYLRNIK